MSIATKEQEEKLSKKVETIRIQFRDAAEAFCESHWAHLEGNSCPFAQTFLHTWRIWATELETWLNTPGPGDELMSEFLVDIGEAFLDAAMDYCREGDTHECRSGMKLQKMYWKYVRAINRWSDVSDQLEVAALERMAAVEPTNMKGK